MATIAEHDEDTRVLNSAVQRTDLDPVTAAERLLRQAGATDLD